MALYIYIVFLLVQAIVMAFYSYIVVLLVQAYVQQLESSRMKLTQLEQELQRARQQVCSVNLVFLSVFFFDHLNI